MGDDSFDDPYGFFERHHEEQEREAELRKSERWAEVRLFFAEQVRLVERTRAKNFSEEQCNRIFKAKMKQWAALAASAKHERGTTQAR